ncbi:MAG TPA: ATP-grasp domain-containing protein [Pseudolabrys sp.]|nr:ATP-grasp domain-containing protein [Pseudolabrys sp.]
MQLHEHQAKKVLSRYAIAIPEGLLATTADEAEAAATRLGPGTVFVKAQSLAGDRAAAGGVRPVESASLAKAVASQLLGRKLVTTQTGENGQLVKKVLVERGVRAVNELYLALSIDAASSTIVITAAQGGGSGIEQRLATAPLGVLRLGMTGERHAGDIAAFCGQLGLSEAAAEKLAGVIARLHRAFIELDASLIEINPLALTESGELIAIDAKLALDDNAAFRHADLLQLGEEAEADLIELKAQRHQINFMQMDGNIGTVVNGAGLGLATLDMLRAAGGAPANFMDIRTTAKSMDIAQGIALVLDNPRVKVLLVNVFGGGMQPCDTIVEGLGIAFRRHARRLPIVLRVKGNNEEMARLRLANFDLQKIECADMWQAVTRAVAIAQGRA